VSRTLGIRTPADHCEYVDRYMPRGERELKMTRDQHEDIILGRKTWYAADPEFEMHLAALFLAAVGELGGPPSRLGATRAQALRALRRRLTRAHMLEIEEAVEDYDLSTPHPPFVFGPGWTDADDRLLTARSAASDERDGVPTERQWTAERHRHWHYRLVDRMPSRRRIAYALSVARRWRRMRYAVHR
jgi:hypothetical protein